MARQPGGSSVGRSGFALRLAATVVLTTLAVGAAQYVLADRALTERVLSHDLDGHRADADVLAALYRPSAADPLSEVASLLGHMASRPNLSSVVLLGPEGELLVSGSGRGTSHPPAGAAAQAPVPGTTGTEHRTTGAVGTAAQQGSSHRLASRVLMTGTAQAQRMQTDGKVVHAVPVELGSGRHVLVVERPDAALEAQVAQVRRVLLLTLALGALLFLPLFFLVGGRDLTARHRRAVHASTTDGLTGLGNHGSFHERLAAAVAERSTGSPPLCLALLDLDAFKEINDLAGHRRGDDVLRAVAGVLRDVSPGAHRVGGDEFAVLLAVPLGEARTRCERLRADVADLDLGVTTSIGLAALRPGGTPQGLGDAADAALYAAKRAGRDQVMVDAASAPHESC